jgi:flagellar biogenesis protein FliO
MSQFRLICLFIVVCGFAAWVRAEGPGSSAALPPDSEMIPLRPRGSTTGRATGSSGSPTGTMTTVVGALAVCLGIFLLLVWVTKRSAPAGSGQLPKEVVESLGRVPLQGRQQLQLLRIGRKLLLIHVTPHGAETLTEIADQPEVERILGLCQQTRPTSVSSSFREILTQYESEPAAKGFLGDARQSDWELATRAGRNRLTRQEEIDG